MNELGKKQVPYVFVISFDKSKALVIPIAQLTDQLYLNIEGRFVHLPKEITSITKPAYFKKHPMAFEQYQKAFDHVMENLHLGNSYLANLTFSTKIETDLDLLHIFSNSKAKYSLYIPDWFTVFSPECFVKVVDDHIYTYPMKGTIDAAIPNAETLLMEDEKEMAEHYTIVDFLRNDLSMVAEEVRVVKFRYLDTIETHSTAILQTSSEIKGKITEHFKIHHGDLMDTLLPAGSISGAPKAATLKILKESELDERGFYTGVFGVFDGHTLESAVMIRYIEKQNNTLFYRSGGGITYLSNAEAEYKEMIDKVYVPIG